MPSQIDFPFLNHVDGKGKIAVVLVSGGMDSSTLLAYIKSQNWQVHAVNIDYNQRHRKEIKATKELCNKFFIPLEQLKFDLTQFGDSPLTNKNIDVPRQDEGKQRVTVVGYRNTFFLTMAAAYAQTAGSHDIFIAPCLEDFQNYKDCRQEFYDSLEKTLSLGSTEEGYEVKIHTPFIKMNKAQIIALGMQLDETGWIYKNSWTCYNGREKHCGVCDACIERVEGFKKAGIEDPTKYEVAK